jgi:hypothetical protein
MPKKVQETGDKVPRALKFCSEWKQVVSYSTGITQFPVMRNFLVDPSWTSKLENLLRIAHL